MTTLNMPTKGGGVFDALHKAEQLFDDYLRHGGGRYQPPMKKPSVIAFVQEIVVRHVQRDIGIESIDPDNVLQSFHNMRNNRIVGTAKCWNTLAFTVMVRSMAAPMGKHMDRRTAEGVMQPDVRQMFAGGDVSWNEFVRQPYPQQDLTQECFAPSGSTYEAAGIIGLNGF